jgi:hypothetical protein
MKRTNKLEKLVLVCKKKDCGMKQYPNLRTPVPLHCINPKCGARPKTQEQRLLTAYVNSIEALLEAMRTDTGANGEPVATDARLHAATVAAANIGSPFKLLIEK